MNVEINKNGINENENVILAKSIKLKTKIFEFFSILLNKKSKTNKFTLLFLHILEIIQLISFAFFKPHLITWKISQKSIEIISFIVSIFRLTPLLDLVSYKFTIILFIILIILTFLFSIILVMQILFRNDNSKIYKKLLFLTHISIAPLTIFLYIPINELLLITFKCDILKNHNNEMKCWEGMHILYIFFGILSIIFSLINIIFLNFFYFYPFQYETSTIKLNSTIDIILILIKLLYVLKIIFINNEYLSILILLIPSIFLIIQEFKYPTYNCYLLEMIINIRNSLILWTYFMLFIVKLCHETQINGLIYLVFMGYPIIIIISILLTEEAENSFNFKKSNLNNIKSCLSKIRILIKLINSFPDKNHYNFKNNEKGNKNDILLKGLIKIHTEKCLDEECPLKKFIKNYGNFNIQKQCLLNYMTHYFNKAMKHFPNSKIIRLYYIQFNFSKKYNLNSVRANLEYIKRLKNNIKEEFIVYYIENKIITMKDKPLNLNEGNELEQDNIFLQQNYKKLKDLIINSTKLYAEFWGIFSNNITNNLNISKLYKIGENLNIYLKEINDLWKNNLKNKALDIENEYILQLYSRFLIEILLDKSSSEEVQKKINEEYHYQGYKSLKHNNKKDGDFGLLIDNQDYLIFVNSNEKGKSKIFQFSNSLSYLIGYEKKELINKPIDILIPSIFIEGHDKKIEEFIKNTHLIKNSEKDSIRGIEKKKSFMLIKSKMGYLVPFNAKFTISDDKDFSNNFIIKAHLEQRDSKLMYAYYILTKNDFSVDNISSSAIHMGLSIDLLKKYVIKINLLIRTSKDNDLNLFEKYKVFEEESKKITWIYPDLIYPNNTIYNNKDKKIDDLIKISNKKKLNLQIIEMKYKENEIIGFVFKFFENQKNKKNKNIILPEELIPSSYKNIIMFDVLTLNYIRTKIVKLKTGLRNLRERGDENLSQKYLNMKLDENIKTQNDDMTEETLEEEENEDVLLTKDKLIELQAKNSKEIESFINLLPFYGENIFLIKHNVNKEEYISGKTREPLLRINVNIFTKRIIGLKLKKNSTFFSDIKNELNKNKRNSLLNENNGLKTNIISSIINSNGINNDKEKDGINKNLNCEYSITSTNIFNENNIKKIKLIDFLIYIIILLLLIFEFYFTNLIINKSKKKFFYLDNSYKILNNILYTKYLITEAIIANTIPNYKLSEKFGKINFINNMKSELSNCHKEFTDLYGFFNLITVKISKKFYEYMYYNFTIKTLNNGIPKDEELPLNSAMKRLSSAVFYISNNAEIESINMNNKYSYELMLNLMNVYYQVCVNMSKILLDDINESVKNPGISLILIIFISLFLSFFSFFSFYSIFIKLIKDRERPINLFLTIKKNLFEYLKITSENFSNKLLNKFFGNDENEEESQQNYKNIKTSDINIAKFKEKNGNKQTYIKGGTLISFIGQLLFFFIIYELYIILKYFNSKIYFSNVYQFNDVYNTTQLANIILIIRTNIIKQYFFNNTLPIFDLNTNLINNSFYNAFYSLSFQFGKTILLISKTDSFLKNDYKKLFKEYMYNDFFKLIENENIANNTYFNERIKNGFKPVEIETIQILKYIMIKYYIEIKNNNGYINKTKILNDENWYDIHLLLNNLVRQFNDNIIGVMNSCFYSKVNNLQTIYISLFIVMIVLNTIIYFIIWKSYEERFHNVLKKSFDLINLIPKEIKAIIVYKMNE